PSSFFSCSGRLSAQRSFPTRRSSDLRSGTVSVECFTVHLCSDLSFGVLWAFARLWGYGNVFIKRSIHIEVGQRYQHGAGCLRRVDRKSTRLNSSHVSISYAVFCLKKK